jgi:hypothetical protein
MAELNTELSRIKGEPLTLASGAAPESSITSPVKTR